MVREARALMAVLTAVANTADLLRWSYEINLSFGHSGLLGFRIWLPQPVAVEVDLLRHMTLLPHIPLDE
jgi:hypothetical protein